MHQHRYPSLSGDSGSFSLLVKSFGILPIYRSPFSSRLFRGLSMPLVLSAQAHTYLYQISSKEETGKHAFGSAASSYARNSFTIDLVLKARAQQSRIG